MSFNVIRNIDVQLFSDGFSLGSENREVTFALSVKSVRLSDDESAVATVCFYYGDQIAYIKDYGFSYNPDDVVSIFQQAEAAVKALEPETVI